MSDITGNIPPYHPIEHAGENRPFYSAFFEGIDRSASSMYHSSFIQETIDKTATLVQNHFSSLIHFSGIGGFGKKLALGTTLIGLGSFYFSPSSIPGQFAIYDGLTHLLCALKDGAQIAAFEENRKEAFEELFALAEKIADPLLGYSPFPHYVPYMKQQILLWAIKENRKLMDLNWVKESLPKRVLDGKIPIGDLVPESIDSLIPIPWNILKSLEEKIDFMVRKREAIPRGQLLDQIQAMFTLEEKIQGITEKKMSIQLIADLFSQESEEMKASVFTTMKKEGLQIQNGASRLWKMSIGLISLAKNSNGESDEEEKITKTRKELREYRKSLITKNPTLFLSAYLYRLRKELALQKYRCPSSQETMEEPIRLPGCGHLIDKKSLENEVKDKKYLDPTRPFICPCCEAAIKLPREKQKIQIKSFAPYKAAYDEVRRLTEFRLLDPSYILKTQPSFPNRDFRLSGFDPERSRSNNTLPIDFLPSFIHNLKNREIENSRSRSNNVSHTTTTTLKDNETSLSATTSPTFSPFETPQTSRKDSLSSTASSRYDTDSSSQGSSHSSSPDSSPTKAREENNQENLLEQLIAVYFENKENMKDPELKEFLLTPFSKEMIILGIQEQKIPPSLLWDLFSVEKDELKQKVFFSLKEHAKKQKGWIHNLMRLSELENIVQKSIAEAAASPLGREATQEGKKLAQNFISRFALFYLHQLRMQTALEDFSCSISAINGERVLIQDPIRLSCEENHPPVFVDKNGLINASKKEGFDPDNFPCPQSGCSKKLKLPYDSKKKQLKVNDLEKPFKKETEELKKEIENRTAFPKDFTEYNGLDFLPGALDFSSMPSSSSSDSISGSGRRRSSSEDSLTSLDSDSSFQSFSSHNGRGYISSSGDDGSEEEDGSDVSSASDLSSARSSRPYKRGKKGNPSLDINSPKGKGKI